MFLVPGLLRGAGFRLKTGRFLKGVPRVVVLWCVLLRAGPASLRPRGAFFFFLCCTCAIAEDERSRQRRRWRIAAPRGPAGQDSAGAARAKPGGRRDYGASSAGRTERQPQGGEGLAAGETAPGHKSGHPTPHTPMRTLRGARHAASGASRLFTEGHLSAPGRRSDDPRGGEAQQTNPTDTSTAGTPRTQRTQPGGLHPTTTTTTARRAGRRQPSWRGGRVSAKCVVAPRTPQRGERARSSRGGPRRATRRKYLTYCSGSRASGHPGGDCAGLAPAKTSNSTTHFSCCERIEGLPSATTKGAERKDGGYRYRGKYR